MSRALVLPFTTSNTALPSVATVTPLIGAMRDYNAELLTDGYITSWGASSPAGSLAGGTSSAGMQVVTEGGRKHVKFDGLTRADETFGSVLAQPLTIAMRLRFPTAFAASRTLLASPVAPTVVLGTNTAGTGFQAYAGSTLANAIGADTNWHTLVAVFNGASSVMRVDGVEVAGNAGSTSMAGLRIATSTGFSGTATIDVRRLVLFTRALSSTERADLVAALA